MGRRSVSQKGLTWPFYRWINEQLTPQYRLPVYGYGDGVRDWNIFSPTIEEDFNARMGFQYHTVVRYTNPEWFYHDQRVVLDLLQWAQTNIFEKLFDMNRTTLKVLLAIATSKIMNSRLDILYQSEMVEHMNACANIRFALFEDYLNTKILQLPF